jgi:hypothetical protein
MFPEFPVHLLINRLQDLPLDYAGAHFGEMADGAGPYGLSTPNFLRRFSLSYEGLTQIKSDEISEHHREVYNEAGGFKFHHPRTNTLYDDVHYESFEYPQHSKLYVQERHLILVVFTAGVIPGGIRSSITKPMTASQTFMFLANAPAFPLTGFLHIGSEIISYGTHTEDGRRLIDLTRGVQLTTAAAHAVGEEVTYSAT